MGVEHLRKLMAAWAVPVAVAALCAVSAPPASAYVYMPDGDGELITANLDGSNLQTTALPASGGIATDGTYLYYATNDAAGHTFIGRMHTDGSAADGSFLPLPAVPCTAGFTGPPDAGAITVDGQHIYWADTSNGTIGRANLDGSGANGAFIAPEGGASCATDVTGVAVDSGHVYWTERNDDAIGRANLDGSDPDSSFITGLSSPTAIAVSGANLYWLNSRVSDDGSGWIGHAVLDTAGAVIPASVDQTFIGPLASYGSDEGLTTHDAFVYFDNGDGWIGRAALDGSSPTPHLVQEELGATQSLFTPIAVDDNHSAATSQTLSCSPTSLQLLYPLLGPTDVGIMPPVHDTTHCAVTVRDSGSQKHLLSGTASLTQSPVAGDLDFSCNLVAGSGQASCSFPFRTDAASEFFKRPSSVVQLTSAFAGDLADDASTATASVALQRVRPCKFTRDAESPFYAWLCLGSSNTPVTELRAVSKGRAGTLVMSSPYSCAAVPTPITFALTFTPAPRTHAKASSATFKLGVQPSKTVRRAPFKVRFIVASKNGIKRRITASARVALTGRRGHHAMATIRLVVPHC
ncbi:MAG TPA: hypothetical protein VNV17_10735 [Solirubrobacteraceae bacterium]|nr:hypothetical protein [Solirubrobacteraceae bacterium]